MLSQIDELMRVVWGGRMKSRPPMEGVPVSVRMMSYWAEEGGDAAVEGGLVDDVVLLCSREGFEFLLRAAEVRVGVVLGESGGIQAIENLAQEGT